MLTLAARDLGELIRNRIRSAPERVAFTFPGPAGADEILRYGDLDREARRIAAVMSRTVATDEPVLLLLPPGADYVRGLYACLYAGRIAVPAPPPVMDRNVERLRGIVRDTGARTALVSAGHRPRFERRFQGDEDLGRLWWRALHDLAAHASDSGWSPQEFSHERVALLQYTSGSTARPRGVRLTHGNLLHNAAAIHARFGTEENSSGVFWLPPYHDMGLIGAVLHPVLVGGRAHLLSPLDFLKNPLVWLKEIADRRASISGAPNFAYDLCAARMEADGGGPFDLSCWELAFCGAEPVRAATLERFARVFAPHGFRPESFLPCYGLAEATLLVSGAARGAGPRVREFRRSALEAGHARVRENPEDESSSGDEWTALVSSGASAGPEIRVVDPEQGRELPAGEIGEIWLRGPSVSPGYLGHEDLNAETFGARLAGEGDGVYLRTGDLGFLHEDELYLYGRRKDMLIVRGRNIDPGDLELAAAGAVSDSGRGPDAGASCAAFALDSTGATETEGICLMYELERDQVDRAGEIMATIRARLVSEFGVPLSRIALLRRGGLPRTTSGKIQRRLCRSLYLAGELTILEEGSFV